MASNDPKSRLESTVNSPSYPSPNGVTEQRGMGISTSTPESSATRTATERQPDESAGEKIGRFFRKAMDRISGHDEDAWRRSNDRNIRDREMQERYRAGDRSWQYGRSALRERGQDEWSDLGRSRDDRNLNYRAGPSSDTGGRYEKFQTGRQGGYERDEGGSRQGPSFGDRSAQSMGQRGPGRSPSESYGLGEIPSDRPIGSDRGLLGDQGGDDWKRGDPGRLDPSRDRWAAEPSRQSGATAMSSSYEERMADWGETGTERDRGQGRRFWQREPLAARDVMTRNPRTVTRQSAHREAASIMRDENCGVIPVVDEAGRLEGILTDRDIVVRGVAHDRAHELRIEDVMTDDVSAVTEDEPLTSVLDLMGRRQIRRVPVVDREDRLLGIISMADIANRADYDEDLQDAFERISSRRSFWSLFS